MAMLPDKMFQYIVISLEGAPTVVEALLEGFGGGSEKCWDARPLSDRFTIREVLAHLADWDEIFLHRLQRTLTEDRPSLPDIDEGVIASQRNYSEQPVSKNVSRFKENRAKLVEFARSMTSGQRAMLAQRELIGELSAETQLAFITAHDGYHTRQIAEYRMLLA